MREKFFSDSKAGRVEPSKSSDIRYRARGPAGFFCGFQFCFGPVFPNYALVPPFWNGNVYSLTCSMETRDLIFDFTGVYY